LKIAYLTGASWRRGALAANGLPPPEVATYEAIAAAGAEAGLRFEIARWEDEALLRAPPAAALIRSCWDYPERAGAFVERLEALEAAGVRVINPAAIVRWNLRKTYLAAFAAAGVETIPTLFVERCDARAVLRAFDTFDAAELVIKPQIGAGARDTIRVRRNVWSEMDLPGAPQGPAMLQPYLPAIETEGERSLFYFGGALAYAIHKRPAAGSWLANQENTAFAHAPPLAEDAALAARVIAAAPAGLVYARVDIVTGNLGRPALIELEAIEPQLFLNLAPEGAGFFVRALAEALAPGAGVLNR
jgi:glutathione synthase/RimK-type ligase-like ATP-grasp enzyme